jgi:hypothetical protein
MICIRTGVQAQLGLSRNYWITMFIVIKVIGSTLLVGELIPAVGVASILRNKPKTTTPMAAIAPCG